MDRYEDYEKLIQEVTKDITGRPDVSYKIDTSRVDILKPTLAAHIFGEEVIHMIEKMRSMVTPEGYADVLVLSRPGIILLGRSSGFIKFQSSGLRGFFRGTPVLYGARCALYIKSKSGNLIVNVEYDL